MLGFHNKSYLKQENPHGSLDLANLTISKTSKSKEFFENHFDPSEILSIEVTSYDRTDDVNHNMLSLNL